MDGWQTSVEKRLDSLDRRAGSLDEGVSSVRERLARVETKIDELPTKGYIDARLLAMLALITALILFADKIKALLG